jgi:hypothetical protein
MNDAALRVKLDQAGFNSSLWAGDKMLEGVQSIDIHVDCKSLVTATVVFNDILVEGDILMDQVKVVVPARKRRWFR